MLYVLRRDVSLTQKHFLHIGLQVSSCQAREIECLDMITRTLESRGTLGTEPPGEETGLVRYRAAKSPSRDGKTHCDSPVVL